MTRVFDRCANCCALYKELNKWLYFFHDWFVWQTFVLKYCMITYWIPMTCALGDAMYQMMLIFHTWLTYVLVKYKQIVEMQQVSAEFGNKNWSYLWLVLYLQALGGKQAGYQYLCKYIIPITWQVSVTDKCLSNMPVRRTLLYREARWKFHQVAL